MPEAELAGLPAPPESPAGTMTAGVFSAPREAALRAVPRPEPGPAEVLVRLEGCGVCGSNLPLWEGRDWFQYPRPPGEPGHEGWGRVVEVGAAVAGVAVGDRVTGLSQRAFAEYDLMAADQIVTLPAALDGIPFPGEPLGCAMNVFRRSDIRPGQTVAVIGIGFLGALLVRLASRAGARVIAISRRLYALEIAQQMGADITIPLDDHDRILERVRDLTAGAWCERVIEAVGRQWPLDLAGALTGERGRLIIAGFHQDGPRQVDMQTWNWRGIDVVNAHERDPAVYVEGIRMAVDAVERGIIDPTPLFTHRVPLRSLAEAMELMRTRPDGFLKALVTA